MHGFPYIEHISYFGIFLTMAMSGYIIPVPEEVILLGAGYLIASSIVNPVLAIIVGILGAIVGDSFIYWLCHHGSRFADRLRGRVEHSSHARWYENWIEGNTGLAIFTMRFVPGMRFLSPVIAGVSHINWKKFLFFNALAALCFVPIIVGLGYIFADHIHHAILTAILIRHTITVISIWAIAIAVFMWFLYWLFKRDS